QGIESVASKLGRLVPEAHQCVAHGQMPEEQLERSMLRFAQGECDVLVCTTIIESGLDIPNVNTIVVNNAHRFGLSQLYQLRGRVGGGANRAYAYMLYPAEDGLTEEAEKRLRTIFEATELGAGFRIAMKDLEIRGAGNLLGAEQHGHISAVGFELYTRLLGEAVQQLSAIRAGTPLPRPEEATTALDLPPLDARRLARELAVPIVAGSNQVRFPRGAGQGWLATLDRLVELLPREAGEHPAASASAPVR